VPANAVITVTRGLLDRLDRDALQAVVAHEFSHILNGDMRLNIRLLGLLAGITMLAELGAAPWRDARFARAGYSGGHTVSPLGMLFGALLLVVGSAGLLTGRIIKAALSRQREYLADAAAVQFTRNPDALATALLTLHRVSQGSALAARHAEEVSHMGFGQTVAQWSAALASHPPIEQRIAALGPKYELWFNQAERQRRRRERARGSQTSCGIGESPTCETDGHSDRSPERTNSATLATDQQGSAVTEAMAEALSAAALAAIAGRPDRTPLEQARYIIKRLPNEIVEALHTPSGAADTVAALLFHGANWREADRVTLSEDRREPVTRLRLALEMDCADPQENQIDPSMRLPVLELALPSLRRLSHNDRQALMARIDALIRVDRRLSIFEFVARTLVRHCLESGAHQGVGVSTLRRQRDAVAVVVSLVAHAGAGEAAYKRAIGALLSDRAPPMRALSDCDLKAFSQALDSLGHLEPSAKRSLLNACGDCITGDGVIRPGEAELLRTLGAILETPIPPIVGSDPSTVTSRTVGGFPARPI
jgi:hypothetical protein